MNPCKCSSSKGALRRNPYRYPQKEPPTKNPFKGRFKKDAKNKNPSKGNPQKRTFQQLAPKKIDPEKPTLIPKSLNPKLNPKP